ncbi:MAG: response regulator [Spirochaetota bacterium]|jgi:two-component system response regulator YesN
MNHILLVDDEPLVRLTIRSLEDWHKHNIDFTYEAANGQDALYLIANKTDIDAIVLDVEMPLMNGLELAEYLYTQGKKIPILFLSAFNNFDFARRAFKAGAVDYILKSELDEGRLLKALQQLFKKAFKNGSHTPKTEEHAPQKNILIKLLQQNPLDQSTIDTLQGSFEFPAILLLLYPIDISAIKERYTNDLLSFERIVIDLLKQAFYKIPYTEIVSISFERYLVVLPSEQYDTAVIDTFLRSAQHYLDTEFAVLESAPFYDVQSIHQVYSELEGRVSNKSRLVLRARRYIRQHYSNPDLNLNKIASFVGISKNHLSYEYARETGETIFQYLSKVRIEVAKHLLSTSSLKIYEIAEQVGFKNVETFCRVFKKITGKNPRNFCQ